MRPCVPSWLAIGSVSVLSLAKFTFPLHRNLLCTIREHVKDLKTGMPSAAFGIRSLGDPVQPVCSQRV